MKTLALAALLAAPAAALKPATKAVLAEIGFQAESPQISAIAGDVIDVRSDDGVEKVSLDSLAAKRDLEGLKRFVATRGYMLAFKKDPNAKEPKAELYNGLWLTASEKAAVANKLREEWSRLGRKL